MVLNGLQAKNKGGGVGDGAGNWAQVQVMST